jgi:hypothetical protein
VEEKRVIANVVPPALTRLAVMQAEGQIDCLDFERGKPHPLENKSYLYYEEYQKSGV